MSKRSLLLGLSGSKQSRYAAEAAWELARLADANVLAQHVVDSRTAWELLRADEPGFIGSGLYINAYETLCESLRVLASKLAEKYEAVVASQSIESECVIDEGNPVKEISKRAANNDLVAIGHRPTGVKASANDRCHYVRYSIAEGLAHECPCPLLIVQNKVKPWKRAKILVSIDHLNTAFIRVCVQATTAFTIEPQILCLASGTDEEDPSQFRRDFRKANADLADVDLKVDVLKSMAIGEKVSLWKAPGAQIDLDCDIDTLLVIPTREIGHKRITIFGSSPDNFIRHLTLPSILLWPEEHVAHAQLKAPDELSHCIKVG